MKLNSNVRLNSLRAFSEERERLSEREKLILAFILRSDIGKLTDRRITMRMGFDDMNCVRPRVTSLIQKGFLYEAGRVRCRYTGKAVRYVAAMDREEE